MEILMSLSQCSALSFEVNGDEISFNNEETKNMNEELMPTSYIEDPSFERSFGAMEMPPMAKPEIADVSFDDFEFAFSSVNSELDHTVQSNADEIFKNGRILPVNPVYNAGSKAHEEELKSSTSSISLEVDNILKSNSTGSVALDSRRLRLRKIVFGRSRSDGDKSLLSPPALGDKKIEMSCFFLSSFSHKSATKEGDKRRKSRKENSRAAKELDFVSAHRNYYGGQMFRAGSRRSFLPYRQELLAGCCFFRHNPL